MTLLEQLTNDRKDAMRNKEEPKKTTLNMILASIKNKKIELQRDLEDDEIIKIIQKENKAIKEAIGYLEKANKEDDILIEQQKIAILENYLPQLLGEEETKKIIQDIMTELKITDVNSQRGQLMGAIMGKYKGQIDGSLVNKIISQL